MLTGYKTYIIGALGLITVALYVFQVIDVTTANAIEGFLGFGSVISLRAAVKNI